jgi:integrase
MKRQDGYLTKESGSWLGHYSRWVTDYATGARKRQQRAFKIGPVSSVTKTQAREKLRERIVKDLGITADSRVTVAWFIEHRWKPLREGSWRDSTKAVNAELLKFVIDRFGATPLEDIDNVAMQAWLADLAKKKSASLVIHCRMFLRSIMGEALEQDYVRKNPARLLRLPKLKAVVRPYLEVDEVTALLKAATWQPRESALLTMMLVTGFRPSELFALKWKCFDGEARTITIAETVYRGQLRPFTKTTEEGDSDHVTMFLPESATLALMSWYGNGAGKYAKDGTTYVPPNDDDYIFPNSDGGFIQKENYQKRVLTPLAKEAGISKVNFQILRRTVATHAQHLGSPKDISVVLRHKKVEVAQQHYVQKIEQSVKDMTEALATKLLPGKRPQH